MKNIALVGFMGTGKTTVGCNLAARLNREYIDLDDLIEKKESMKIRDIFKNKGEAYFRQVEKDIVYRISKQEEKIIACGGGVVLDKENIENLKNTGVVICLAATADIILERTKAYKHRPLLNVSDKKAKIEELLNARQDCYARSDYTIDTSGLSVLEVVDDILKWVNNKI